MTKNETIDECGKLRFSLDRSIRYCHAVAANWDLFSVFVQFVNLLGIGLAFLSLSGRGNIATSFVALSISLLSVLSELVLRPAARISRMGKLSNQYTSLLARLPLSNGDADEKTIVAVREEKARLDDLCGNVIPCLSVACHNEVCVAVGRPESIRKMNLVQATVGQVCRFVKYSEQQGG